MVVFLAATWSKLFLVILLLVILVGLFHLSIYCRHRLTCHGGCLPFEWCQLPRCRDLWARAWLVLLSRSSLLIWLFWLLLFFYLPLTPPPLPREVLFDSLPSVDCVFVVRFRSPLISIPFCIAVVKTSFPTRTNTALLPSSSLTDHQHFRLGHVSSRLV
jgi:hypothetical protein